MAIVQSMIAAASNAVTFSGGSTNYAVETDAGVQYQLSIDSALDVVFSKSTDSGKTWATGVVVFAGSATQLSVWFDKWSGLAGGLIHCAYTESAGDDVLYRSINTASADALGTQTTIFAGASTGTLAGISITRTRGGNLICVGTIDDGTENFAKKSTDAGANWGDIAAVMEAAAGDQVIMAPGFAADNQDAMCFFWDADASEVSVKFYDDSGDSWSETAIAGSMTIAAPNTAYPMWSAAVDLANTNVLLAAWSASDTLNADLRVWTVDEAAQTELANVVTNSTDDQGVCAISLDTTNGDIYVAYLGLTGGSETAYTAINAYYKVSTDDGATWGAETRLTPASQNIMALWTNPRQVYLSGELVVTFRSGTGTGAMGCISIEPTLPTAAQVQSGVTFGINGTQFSGTFTGGAGGNANILGGSVIQ